MGVELGAGAELEESEVVEDVESTEVEPTLGIAGTEVSLCVGALQIRADGTCNAPGGNRPPVCGSDCDPTCKYGSAS